MSGQKATRRIRIRHGLNVPILGKPEQVLDEGPAVRHVALCGPDYVGLKPRMLVAKGDPVGLGQPLFIDKRDAKVQYVSPGRGTVRAINRGPRRVLESVVVELGDADAEDLRFDALSAEEISRLDPGHVAERLQQSGLWTAFRTRPFNQVPMSDSRPRSLFVTAIDTRPLAADPRVVVEQARQAFATGLQVISRLAERSVFLSTAPGWGFDLPAVDRLQHVEFSGPHPAGLPGTHMHMLDPVSIDRVSWHIDYQEVIAIGRLFMTGEIDPGRIVALGGSRVKQPRLVRSRLGASIDELMTGGVEDPEECRLISGCVLCGSTVNGSSAYLGRYHSQVSVIAEGGDRRLFGWLGISPRRYTAAPTLLRQKDHKRSHAFSTAQNGRFTGMIPSRAFDKVTPLDILPSPLFRALLVKDTDQAQALGCLELDSEDLALCSFVCPAKNDYGAVLMMNLQQIMKEG